MFACVFGVVFGWGVAVGWLWGSVGVLFGCSGWFWGVECLFCVPVFRCVCVPVLCVRATVKACIPEDAGFRLGVCCGQRVRRGGSGKLVRFAL